MKEEVQQEALVVIDSVTKKYGNFCAVDNISIEIKRGEIFGFLGMNGAGKTTTLRMLAGVLLPTSGSIKINGFDVLAQPVKAKAITGYIPDRPYIYPKLTGKEFLSFIADLYEVPSKESAQRIHQLLVEYGLTQWQDELVDSYSHGMKQRLATAAALVHNPELLIIDEPMVGLDPHGAKLLKDQMRRYATEGKGIFLSTHSLNVAEEVADRLAIIHHGKLLIQGTLDDLHERAGTRGKTLEQLFLQLTESDSPYQQV